MEEAMKKAEAGAAQEPQPATKPDQPAQELEIDFDVKETGQSKAINGFDTRQVVMTVTMREKGKTIEQSGGLVLTTDLWLTPSIATLKEIVDFDIRYAQKLAGPMIVGASPEEMASALAMYPGLKEALARARAEGAKMDGTAILTTVTVDAVKSAEQLAAEKQSGAGAAPPPTSVGGLIGGLARRAVKPEEPRARATFMTSATEVLKVSTTVAAADVAVPSGFKEEK
jgi:hypothetical protein